ncbi:flippase [Geoalkalibacter halelectricus]|uniref:Flippase n=2 Tax=Geoalkalibacter halelectricus TaxID=2847045 RepID=A0ABY5ZLU3_9BACT|nr:flippase [Geoalkalibacter halelectricus]UWZ79583.1 flippase [Geoalkalibacter halelectricus]
MGEKFFTLGIGFFVTVLLARYLGPEQFGIIAYALSMVALFATAGHMGLSGLVVREIVKKADLRSETLGTTIVLKFLGYALGFIALVIYALLYEERQSVEFWALLIVGSSLLFRPLSVIDFWFQAHVQARFTAIARSCALVIAAAVKVALVIIGAEVLMFAYAHLLEVVLAGIFLAILYRHSAALSLFSWRFNLGRAKELLSQGWMVLLGALFATVYLRIDQVMLKWFIGVEEVGVYAVAAKLSETWYFVPTAIVASLFPRLIKLKETDPQRYAHRLQQIFELLFAIALGVAIFMSFVSTPLVSLFFGEKYLASAPILAIHIWAALFIFMRAAFSKWILIEDALMFSLITQGFGAVANVGLNLLLIPHYAGYGAAIATLLSYAVASYFSLFFYKKSRPVFWMMSNAMLAPVRYPYRYLKGKIA